MYARRVRACLAVPLVAATLLAAAPASAQGKPLPADLTPAPWPRLKPSIPDPDTSTPHLRVLPWKDGDDIPAGYHEGWRVRTGLVIAGVSVLGSFWLPTCVIGSLSGDAATTIQGCAPVVGPFSLAGQLGRDNGNGVLVGFVIADGLLQTGGMAMLIAGLVGERVWLRADVHAARSWWVPMPLRLGSRGAGIGLAGAL